MSMPELAAVREDRSRIGRELSDDRLMRLQRRIDRVFTDFIGAGVPRLDPVRGNGRFSPAVDVSETAGRFEVTAELPGLDAKDIHVTLNDGVLTVKGQKRSDTGRWYVHEQHRYQERGYGAFRRSFALPPEIDTDGVTVYFDNGVLKIVFSRKTAVRAAAFTPPSSQFKFWLLPPPADDRFRKGRPVRSLVRAAGRFLHHRMLRLLRLGRRRFKNWNSYA